METNDKTVAAGTPELSVFIASLELGSGRMPPSSPAASPARQPENEDVYLLDSADVLAHLRYLSEAFCFVVGGDGQRFNYILEVEGLDRGSYLISFVPVAPTEHIVQVHERDTGPPCLHLARTCQRLPDPCFQVAPLEDVPDNQRPSEFACTFTATPASLLTMLAGGAADLRATSLPAMQRFLQAFRFTSYASFCESRGLRPYVVEGASSQVAAMAQARRVARKVAGAAGAALSNSLQSVAKATAAASERARAYATARAAADGSSVPRAEAGEGASFFRRRTSSAAESKVSGEAADGTAAVESGKKWLQGAHGAAAGWLASAATKAKAAVESAKAAAATMAQPTSPNSEQGSSRHPDFSFLFPRSAAAAMATGGSTAGEAAGVGAEGCRSGGVEWQDEQAFGFEETRERAAVDAIALPRVEEAEAEAARAGAAATAAAEATATEEAVQRAAEATAARAAAEVNAAADETQRAAAEEAAAASLAAADEAQGGSKAVEEAAVAMTAEVPGAILDAAEDAAASAQADADSAGAAETQGGRASFDEAAASSGPAAAGLACASCGVERAKDGFSGTQLKKGEIRRCKECVAVDAAA